MERERGIRYQPYKDAHSNDTTAARTSSDGVWRVALACYNHIHSKGSLHPMNMSHSKCHSCLEATKIDGHCSSLETNVALNKSLYKSIGSLSFSDFLSTGTLWGSARNDCVVTFTFPISLSRSASVSLCVHSNFTLRSDKSLEIHKHTNTNTRARKRLVAVENALTVWWNLNERLSFSRITI
jgi:hypothetical protein